MPKSSLTPDELGEHLKEHLGFIEDSARLYDEGKEHEAKRLATSIRVLIHDTSQSHSLLQQLGVKDQINYWNVLLVECPPNTRSYMGIGMSLDANSTRYVANLFPPQRRLAFDQWWEKEPLIVEDTEWVTRKRAVLSIANKDGGAHVAPELSDLDRRLLHTDLMGWEMLTITGAQQAIVEEKPIDIGGTEIVMQISSLEGGQVAEEASDLISPIRAAVRQITHELCGTIREQLSHLLV